MACSSPMRTENWLAHLICTTC